MGVLKNDVGRPSNKTIKIRFILKAVLLIVVAGGLFLGGYLLNTVSNDKFVDTSNKDTSKTQEKSIDISKIKTVVVREEEGDFFSGAIIYDIYYGDKKIISSNDESYLYIVGVEDINIYKNFAIFNVRLFDELASSILIIINSDGNVVGRYDGKYGVSKNLTGSNYRGEYEIREDGIYIHTDDDGQDASTSCERYKSDTPSAYIDLVTYSNGTFITPKLNKSISAREVITNPSLQCGF